MNTLLIFFCIMLIIAYIFDITASKTRIPSIFLLLILGWAVRQFSYKMQLNIPPMEQLSQWLRVLGKIGLVLIVLEGSLELEIKRHKIVQIKKAVLLATMPMIILIFLISLGFYFFYQGQLSMKSCLIGSIPLAIISSAVAISSSKHFSEQIRDFITYESSFSDVLGVILFNFILLNSVYGLTVFLGFALHIILILLISFVATILLAFLLHYLDHSVKFLPIVILVLLIYVVLEVYHLPELIFIMLFGILLENARKITVIYKGFERLKEDLVILQGEVKKFKELIIEATFLFRSCFFLLFGFLIENSEITNLHTLTIALIIVVLILLIRYLMLKVFRLPISPLLYIAPRGLISILLFLSIPEIHQLPIVNRSLMIQVTILSTIVVIVGSVVGDKSASKNKRVEPMV